MTAGLQQRALLDGARLSRARFLRASLGFAAGGMHLIPAFRALAAVPAAPPPDSPLRLGLSDQVIHGVSLNDARAALLVWSTEIGRASGIRLATSQNIILPSEQLVAAIREGTVDLFCVTVQEYRKVSAYVDASQILADQAGGEELLLVVKEGTGITNLAGLKGRSLIILDSPNTTLAEPWLTVSAWRELQQSPQQLFGRTTRNAKMSQVVLPVFFGQADACVVTRRGLDTMFELNPQLAKNLRILLAAPRAVSAFFAFRKNGAPNNRRALLERLVEVRSSPAARQVLTLFQSPNFALFDGDALRPANSILDAFERSHATAAKK